MKKYNTPEVKIAVLNNEDILMISAVGVNLNKFDSSSKYTSIEIETKNKYSGVNF